MTRRVWRQRDAGGIGNVHALKDGNFVLVRGLYIEMENRSPVVRFEVVNAGAIDLPVDEKSIVYLAEPPAYGEPECEYIIDKDSKLWTSPENFGGYWYREENGEQVKLRWYELHTRAYPYKLLKVVD